MAEEPDEAEDPADDDEPTVELGDGAPVEGAPVARVASRLTWPQEKSEIERKEGDTVIRTPDGPQELTSVLDAVDTAYFARRQEFLAAVREAVGTGPIPTE